LPGDAYQEAAAVVPIPEDVPDTELPKEALGFRVQGYGLERHADLFTPRQLTLLTTLSRLIANVRKQCLVAGAVEAYANAVATYLTLALGRVANRHSSQSFWNPNGDKVEQVFARNALPMIWAYAEANPFSSSSGNVYGQVEYLANALERVPAGTPGSASQQNARKLVVRRPVCVTTDPPYYDNIPFADLSDFFYVWERIPVRSLYPELFRTVLVPKEMELLAEPARQGTREAATRFFESGLREALDRIATMQSRELPFVVFYAFRQTEDTDEAGLVSTGWETMLQALIDCGFCVTATWPVRTEQTGGLREFGRNALASSIVLVCRLRQEARQSHRRGFLASLRRELPRALGELQKGSTAPVDLAQAAIGPGMAVFSSYAKVVEPSGEPMRVRTALGLINQVLDEVLAEQEGEFDPATRWAVKWFEQNCYNDGSFGTAEVLAKAQAIAISTLQRAGIVRSKAGKVALLGHEDMPSDWDPATDPTLTAWEVVHQLLKRLDEGGEDAAGALLKQVGGLGEVARDLAYRLYTVADRKGWSTSAQAFNGLVISWRDIVHAAERAPAVTSATEPMFEA
jgi:putative DNA methylase